MFSPQVLNHEYSSVGHTNQVGGCCGRGYHGWSRTQGVAQQASSMLAALTPYVEDQFFQVLSQDLDPTWVTTCNPLRSSWRRRFKSMITVHLLWHTTQQRRQVGQRVGVPEAPRKPTSDVRHVRRQHDDTSSPHLLHI